MRKVVLLGATGSVSQSVLTVIRHYPGRFQVVGLAARRGGVELARLAEEFPDAVIAFHQAEDAPVFQDLLPASHRTVFSGPQAGEHLVEAVEADTCVAAVSGTAGLRMTFAAVRRGMRILLAEKEILVSAGRLFLAEAKKYSAEVIPLDSEHSALFQCLEGRSIAEISRLWITASGGPFRTWTREAIARATPTDALRHPVWRMGAKISVDSASLSNKALECIEAHHLFQIPYERLEILVHPESLVHGMVEFVDGSCLAHLGVANMTLPAAFALFYPERELSKAPGLNWKSQHQFNFEPPDYARFPLLDTGLQAGKRGETAAAAFNAANEMAVELFLAEKISFGDIAVAVAAALERLPNAGEVPLADLAAVEALHQDTRQAVAEWLANSPRPG
ncbi:MAG: 1-deoxy-D-xylulose-5-phosphate reductoisomerase [Planctomycetota bacterium]|jgi:1-deoxy-D-xylulose-5-phosphate reductoisomerase|nr:1-deoxy-D-xylulose-5-phosphate reductoisomerase [Planctomycetota bacterium]